MYKDKKKRLNALIIGVIGGLIGFLISFISLRDWPRFKWITDLTFQPLVYLANLVTVCKESCYSLYLIYPIVMVIVFSLIGILIFYIVMKFRRRTI